VDLRRPKSSTQTQSPFLAFPVSCRNLCGTICGALGAGLFDPEDVYVAAFVAPRMRRSTADAPQRAGAWQSKAAVRTPVLKGVSAHPCRTTAATRRPLRYASTASLSRCPRSAFVAIIAFRRPCFHAIFVSKRITGGMGYGDRNSHKPHQFFAAIRVTAESVGRRHPTGRRPRFARPTPRGR
jgi:hypothetical protein